MQITYGNNKHQQQYHRIRKQLQIIINADDVGWNKCRDQGILQLISNGSISSLSLMMNGQNIDFVISQLLNNYNEYKISVGMHFNLTQGLCLSDKMKKQQITFQGYFIGKQQLYHKIIYQQYQLSSEAVQDQFRSQLEQFIHKYKRRPTHIDGHNHIHCIPIIAKVLSSCMTFYGVYRTRIPLEKISQNDTNKFNLIFIKNAQISAQIYDRAHIIYPEHFIGLTMINNLKIDEIKYRLNSISSKKRNNSVEVMCHPGYADKNSNCQFTSSSARQLQKSQLQSKEMHKLINQMGNLSTYEDLQYNYNRNNVLIYSKMVLGSGNLTTSQRIAIIMRKLNFNTFLRSFHSQIPEQIQRKSLHNFLINFGIRLIIAVNITNTALLIYNSILWYRVPYILISSGTDANHQMRIPNQKSKKLNLALQKSLAIVCISQDMYLFMGQYLKNNLIGTKPIKLIQQSTNITDMITFNIDEQQNILKKYNLWNIKQECSYKYILFPTSFRKVKAVHYLFKQLNNLIQKYKIIVIIAGPIIQKIYYEQLKQNLYEIKYFGVLNRKIYYYLLKNAMLILNSSQSQGMCCSILQAFQVGIPAIVRSNAGNCELIQHKFNGLIYNSTQQFKNIMESLLQNQLQWDELRNQIISNGKKCYEKKYSFNRQFQAYQNILSELFWNNINKINNIYNHQIQIYSSQNIHPYSLTNIQIIQQYLFSQITQNHHLTVLDLGCGSGIFSLIYFARKNIQFLSISLTFSDISIDILSNSLYNLRSSYLWFYWKEIFLIKSDMFSNLSNLFSYDVILSNLPQTPFQNRESRIDKNGGQNGFKYNQQLLQAFSSNKFQQKCQLVLLYCYLSYPKQFFRMIKELNLSIIWQSSKKNHRITVDEYDNMQFGLHKFIKQHCKQGKGEIKIIDDYNQQIFQVPSQLLIINKKL